MLKNNEYIKHLLTLKYIGNASGNEKIANKIFKCKFCNKIYKLNKGLQDIFTIIKIIEFFLFFSKSILEKRKMDIYKCPFFKNAK